MKPDPKEVGNRIKAMRLEKGLTMEEFGNFIDKVNKSAVGNWERGDNLPNKARLKMIAQFGGISVEELLYGSKRNYVIRLIEDVLNTFYNISNADSEVLHELYNRMQYISNLNEYSLTINSLYKLEKEAIDSYIKADLDFKSYDKFEIIKYSKLKIRAIIDDLRRDFMKGGGDGINKDFNTYNQSKNVLFDTLEKLESLKDEPTEINFSNRNKKEKS